MWLKGVDYLDGAKGHNLLWAESKGWWGSWCDKI